MTAENQEEQVHIMGLVRRYQHYPMGTRLGWVVAVGVIEGEAEPTTFTLRGAQELAERLNALPNERGAVARIEAKDRKIAELEGVIREYEAELREAAKVRPYSNLQRGEQ